MKNPTIIVYGSYGYTGQLVVKECKSKNLNIILAGRKREALQKQSDESGYPFEVLDVHDKPALLKLLQKGTVVLHCGGPFIYTAQAMVDACLETKTHYIDITGEYQVFELLAEKYNAKGKEAGIMIMPGTGFDVVPSDCLAVHLKNRLPSATHLHLGFAMSKGGLSRGTKKSMTEKLGHGSLIRKDGVLTSIPMDKSMELDFGSFKTMALNIPWGDVSTAWRSTHIRNIEVYAGATEKMIRNAKRSKYLNWLLRQRWVKDFLLKKIDKGPAGPSDEIRETGRAYLWGKVWDETGKSCESKIETLSGYALTAKTSVLIAEKILAGNFKAGYQTPAMMYGADLILEVVSTKRIDV